MCRTCRGRCLGRCARHAIGAEVKRAAGSIPNTSPEAARPAADFFTLRREKNLEAHAEAAPDDEPLSIFRKDSFQHRPALIGGRYAFTREEKAECRTVSFTGGSPGVS